MITIFLICMFLIFLIYKYASLAILFIFDFVVLKFPLILKIFTFY